ncbi:MBL fold metallo-hydrolase [Cerasicoccus arenae]|uniref:Metallo-beta-lactamase domain-containing protein n=1 Tax=Cerasicoccus arenae TaxID=424488 RepID=A0A8J3DKR1_9BACT|nr:MBL fold metallo-hydrolase [Cerasicoccus arenae]MBK1856870.1 MBL fold metallo-hydrolase [Cerasicoccus arenae]GHC11403.1 hypothetical protein GCM10007047_30930 [Cerasicoccus arenae]
MRIPIEDALEDVIAKAQSGLGLSDGQLDELCGIDRDAIRRLRRGKFDAAVVRGIAPSLGLCTDALIALAEKSWYPDPIEVEGLVCVNLPYPIPSYPEMSVNAYLIGDPASGQAAVFDSGADATPLLDVLQRNGWTLQSIFLTHTHEDHIEALPQLKSALVPGGSVYVHTNELLPGAQPLRDGQVFKIGELEILARETSGHSPGGTSYVIQGLARPIAVVGDALFAGSIGGVRANYPLALKMIRERLLSLPAETVICAGHGPLTTVGNERSRNPFFAANS